MSNRTPPRYVPTLTEVVKSTTGPQAAAPAGLSQEQLIARVMQRVDLTLERRLREINPRAPLVRALNGEVELSLPRGRRSLPARSRGWRKSSGGSAPMTVGATMGKKAGRASTTITARRLRPLRSASRSPLRGRLSRSAWKC